MAHNDIKSHNLILAPDRIVLIDFGEASFREPDDTDSVWEECFTSADDIGALRKILSDGGYRDKTPRPPAENPAITLWGDWSNYNHVLSHDSEGYKRADGILS